MRRLYGRGPLHLLGHLALFALTGYAVLSLFDAIDAAPQALLWLLGAVILHDAILWPLYTGLDRGGQRVLGSAINYVRIPLGLSALLALAFVSTLFGFGASTYTRASGRAWDGYVLRWLGVTVAMFAISAAVFAFRRRRAG